MSDERTPNTEGHDAVCFTAGPKAAIVGAGTIHAYLAARRPAPLVAAGISLGALSAAAMQRAYREVAEAAGAGEEVRRAARWTWFRKYLQALTSRPFEAIWQSLPTQSDFFADLAPIRDASLPSEFSPDETRARRDLYLKVKLGRWLAQLPVTVRHVAGILIDYVRMRERYPTLRRLASGVSLLVSLVWLALLLMVRVCCAPQFFPEYAFRTDERSRHAIPGLGWLNLFSVTVACLILLAFSAAALVFSPPGQLSSAWEERRAPLLVLAALVLTVVITTRYRRWMLRWRLAKVALGGAAYLYTLVNVLSLAGLAATAVWGYWLSVHVQSVDDLPILALVLGVIWLVSSLGAVPFAALPEVRERLVSMGLWQHWPRPLFGWCVFLPLALTLSSGSVSLGLGASFIWNAIHPRDVFQLVGAALFLSANLAAIPTAPPLTLLPSILFWRRLRRLAAARAGWRWVVTASLSVAVPAGLLVLATMLFRSLLYGFHGVLAKHADESIEVFPPAWQWGVFELTTFVAMAVGFVLLAVLTQPWLLRVFGEQVLDNVGLKRSLLPDFRLRWLLFQLFEPESAVRGEARPHLVDGGEGYPWAVIVASPLQALQRNDQRRIEQLRARPGTPVVEALRAGMAVPPFFAPVKVATGNGDCPRADGQHDRAWWLSEEVLRVPANEKALRGGIDLVDGSVVRQNPLPAFFGFIRRRAIAVDLASHNDREHPAVHVVYGVPIGPQKASGAEDRTSPVIEDTIVDVGLASLRLAERRDTQLEVAQTNVISRLEAVVPSRDGADTHPIFADEIAPAEDLSFDNSLSPKRKEIVDAVAAGCRRTLETLYTGRIAAAGAPEAEGGVSVQCESLFGDGQAPSKRGCPGLPEVCERCTGVLRVPESAASTVSVSASLSPPEKLYEEHEQLGGDRPRIVLVASGGVFRGAFHIGLLAALQAARVKPDLIVGASVGTLMGGACGAMSSDPDGDTLDRLLDTFLHVDERVALTQRLKSAARELGIRGRSVKLSPRQVRRMVRRGGRKDPGFATTGAPPALIDAISDLLLIPHSQTRTIAASFVAGKASVAVKKLVQQIRAETIRRLDIEGAIIDTSLLEERAAELLLNASTSSRSTRQPYQAHGIACFGTATDLKTQTATLLGGNGVLADYPYDFVEAALASSAFPAVFEPRRESAVFPGRGSTDALLADGGMFDNLPFLPAIEILSQAQRGYRATRGAAETTLEGVRRRLESPDLMIVGALRPRPMADDPEGNVYDSIETVRRRANSLKHDVKIRSFELAGERIYHQLLRFAAQPPAWAHDTEPQEIDHVVNAAVLAVFPASHEHLNGTFSFCASTGLSRSRLRRSIADGCYQALLRLTQCQGEADSASVAVLEREPSLLAPRSVAALTKARRIAEVKFEWDRYRPRPSCPYFLRDGVRFDCPFAVPRRPDWTPPHVDHGRWARSHVAQRRRIFEDCRFDTTHHRPGRR